VPLTLLAGPANAGKVARLLDRYLRDLQREPVLIVPNRADVQAVERDLAVQAGALIGGTIGTFDDLFGRLAHGSDTLRPVLTDAQRALVVRRVVAAAAGTDLERSARFAGFADTLAATLSELESGLAEPEDIGGELAELYRGYRAELDRLGRWDRDLERRHAANRAASALDAWDGRPVYAYGFEDFTGAQWTLLQALAGRSEVTVSLPYEAGRAAFGSLERTAGDLSRLADHRIEELPAASERYAHPALVHLERRLYEDSSKSPPPLDGAIRFLEAAGMRGALELVADEILALVRAGTPPESVAVVCPALEGWRAPLETAFGAVALPFSVEGTIRLGQTAFGNALVSLLRFGWLGGGRRDLYAFMRSPYSGLRRDHVDFLEGRLRGRAVRTPQRVEEETLRLRGQPLPFLDALRGAPSETAAVGKLAASMLRAAHGIDSPAATESAALDLRAFEAVRRLCEELDEWEAVAGSLAAEDVVAALERAPVRIGSAQTAGRVAVLDLLRVRTRHYAFVFVLGLEEGTVPRRSLPPSLLDEDARVEIEGRARRARLVRPDPVARERYLFYTACTRAQRRLYLVRQSATDDGSPREPSPFWDDVRALFDPEDVARWTRRRPLSQVVWPIEAAPSERERLRAAAALAAEDQTAARGIASANGWERRMERALAAFSRPTRLTHPTVLEELRARQAFGVTELEVFADCSSIWLVERLVDPRPIDGAVDARLRGQVAHTALYRFFSGLPKRLGAERLEMERLEEALAFLGECVEEALSSQALNRLELTAVERHELAQALLRDLEAFVHAEAASPPSLVPRHFEVGFGTERSAPELKAGLDLGSFSLSGKIDRIDLDPFSARGIVQDYKSGQSAHSAAQIESEIRLQIPLYMLVLRDLLGIEPLGGLYRALAGERRARGLLRASAREDGLPGFSARDYLDDEAFWAVVDRAVEHARTFVERIRSGDVRHDPRGGFPCPSWCELAPMCRVRRP
jgi:ATP-dependent helicase/DNAse subunit B